MPSPDASAASSLGLYFNQAGVALQHELGGRFLGFGHVLGHLAHAPLGGDVEIATVFRQRAVEQRKQRGLASAIAANQAHRFAWVDGGGDAVKQHFGAAAQGDIFQRNHEWPRLSPPWAWPSAMRGIAGRGWPHGLRHWRSPRRLLQAQVGQCRMPL